jgi:hypothetical protein
LTLILSLFLIVPLMRVDVRSIATEFVQAYPQDLEITVEDGRLDINQPLPYVVGIPEKIDRQMEKNEPANVVTFTTNDDFGGVQDFARFDSFAVVTESAVYFMSDDDTGEVRAYPIPDSQERVQVNAAFIDDLKEQFLNLPLIKEKLYIPALVGLAFVLGFPALLFGRLIALLVYTFLVYLIAKFFMNNKKFTYGKLYQLSMHSITPVIVISWVAGYLAHYSVHGLLHFVLYAGWTLYLLSQIRMGGATSRRKTSAGKKRSK